MKIVTISQWPLGTRKVIATAVATGRQAMRAVAEPRW
jgi:hypothetical protein